MPFFMSFTAFYTSMFPEGKKKKPRCSEDHQVTAKCKSHKFKRAQRSQWLSVIYSMIHLASENK